MIGAGIIPELNMGLASLLAHKLRSLLTMLGMIFGVGAVVAMLSITAGAQKEMMSFIDQLGVNNIIVEAHEAMDRNELQLVRAVSPGLTLPRFSRHHARTSPGWWPSPRASSSSRRSCCPRPPRNRRS